MLFIAQGTFFWYENQELCIISYLKFTKYSSEVANFEMQFRRANETTCTFHYLKDQLHRRIYQLDFLGTLEWYIYQKIIL